MASHVVNTQYMIAILGLLLFLYIWVGLLPSCQFLFALCFEMMAYNIYIYFFKKANNKQIKTPWISMNLALSATKILIFPTLTD